MHLTIAKVRANQIFFWEGEKENTSEKKSILIANIFPSPGLGKIWMKLVLKTEYGENNVLGNKY